MTAPIPHEELQWGYFAACFVMVLTMFGASPIFAQVPASGIKAPAL